MLAAGLLLLAATTLLATGSLYTDTVALGGLRRTIVDAPPPDRAILVSTTLVPADLERVDAAIEAELRRAMAVTGGDVHRVVRSSSYADASIEPGSVTGLTLFASYADIADHASLVEGTWPVAGAEVIEAVLSEGASIGLDLGVGDQVRLVSRLSAGTRIDVRVVGIWRPDEDDAYWLANQLELSGLEEAGSYVSRGPFVVAEADLLSRDVAARVDVDWRGLPDVNGLRIESIAPFRADLALLDARIDEAVAGVRQFRITAALPTILDEVNRAVLVSRSGILLLTIQFAVLAIYAVILVGGLLLERRRAEVALLRSRGASNGHLLGMALGEALLLALPAAVVAPWLAVAIVDVLSAAGPLAAAGIDVRAGITPAVLLVSALAGLACVGALTTPVLTSGASLAGVRAAIGRQAGRTLPQRLGIDLALVVLAGIGLWQLRLYGAPLTRNARGALGVDPLLVAAPAIGLLAGGILAIRIVPRMAEIAERFLVRQRGLVGPLGGRQLARRPLRYTRAALLLVLAAGLGTFATAHAATWTRSQADQAAYQAAADVRVAISDYADLPGWAIGPTYRGVDGVERATPVERHAFDGGPKVRGQPMLAMDADAAGELLSFPGAEGGVASRSLLAALAAGRPAVAAITLPGEPLRLALSTTSALTVTFIQDDVPVPPETESVRAHVVVQDADGRIHRFTGGTGPLVGEARMEVPLVAIEVELLPPQTAVLEGGVDLEAVELSAAASGDAWEPVGLGEQTPGWTWLRADPNSPVAPYEAPNGEPWRISIGLDGDGGGAIFSPAMFRLSTRVDATTPIPAIAGERYLELTGARIGEEVRVASRGVQLTLNLIGSAREFPPLDPEQSFLIVDVTAMDLARFAALGQTIPADEWWLGVDEGRAEAVAETLAASPYSAATVLTREGLEQDLTSDPVSLGVIGVLGLGALAAVVFAAIGFIVSATVSASERIGEFALLQALGLSGRQLSIWLSLESAFLLIVGIVAGSALGFLLAWLVLPFATLTETGVAAVPSPVVEIPLATIAPSWAAALLLLVVTVLLVRRQLPARRISGVLRARDE